MTLQYKYENSFERTRSPVKEGETINVTTGNADWHLFQLGRDVSLTKGVYEVWKNNQFIEGILPKSLKTFEKPEYDIDEVNVFIRVLHSFITYLERTERPEKIEIENTKIKISNIDQAIQSASEDHLKKRLNGERLELVSQFDRKSNHLAEYVKQLVDTRLTVDGTTVKVSSKDENLVSYLKREFYNSEQPLCQVRVTNGN